MNDRELVAKMAAQIRSGEVMEDEVAVDEAMDILQHIDDLPGLYPDRALLAEMSAVIRSGEALEAEEVVPRAAGILDAVDAAGIGGDKRRRPQRADTTKARRQLVIDLLEAKGEMVALSRFDMAQANKALAVLSRTQWMKLLAGMEEEGLITRTAKRFCPIRYVSAKLASQAEKVEGEVAEDGAALTSVLDSFTVPTVYQPVASHYSKSPTLESLILQAFTELGDPTLTARGLHHNWPHKIKPKLASLRAALSHLAVTGQVQREYLTGSRTMDEEYVEYRRVVPVTQEVAA